MVLVLNTMSYADCLMQKKPRLQRKARGKGCKVLTSQQRIFSELIGNAGILGQGDQDPSLHLPRVEEEEDSKEF